MHWRAQVGGRRLGFTLIELLVVIAVIAILASLMMPVIGRAMEQSVSATCMGHMRQLSQGCIMYASQHSQFIMFYKWIGEYTTRFWQGSLVADGKVDPRELPCPAEAELGKKNWETWGESLAPLWWYGHNIAYPRYELGRPAGFVAPDHVEYLLVTEVENPTKTVYWADSSYHAIKNRNSCDPNLPEDRTTATKRRLSFRHMDGLNLIFFDFHGEWRLGKSIHPRMWCPTAWATP